MEKKLVYLAGAIDYVSEGEAKDWRVEAGEALKVWGHATFSPVHAFSTIKEPDREIAEKILRLNTEALAVCDVVLANLSAPSFGTGAELQMARAMEKTTITFGGSPSSLFCLVYDPFPDLDQAIQSVIAPTSRELKTRQEHGLG